MPVLLIVVYGADRKDFALSLSERTTPGVGMLTETVVERVVDALDTRREEMAGRRRRGASGIHAAYTDAARLVPIVRRVGAPPGLTGLGVTRPLDRLQLDTALLLLDLYPRLPSRRLFA